MTSTVTKLTCAVALAVCLAASLTGCIMYVSPDHTYSTDKSAPPADEKPADVATGSQSF
jgi:hypothetical protein